MFIFNIIKKYQIELIFLIFIKFFGYLLLLLNFNFNINFNFLSGFFLTFIKILSIIQICNKNTAFGERGTANGRKVGICDGRDPEKTSV